MQRIVSLVPSQTELLYDLGLEAEVVGITKFCVHPERWFHSKPRVGGTKQVSIEKVAALQPTIIIANREENVREQVEALEVTARVWVSDVTNIASALEMINTVGEFTDKSSEARSICNEIEAALKIPKTDQSLSAAYLIWNDPIMVAGGDTFISDMMRNAGLRNVFGNKDRYPAVTLDELRSISPDVLILSSEPFPFKASHAASFSAELPGTMVRLADGEMFSWYGSRMRLAGPYLREFMASLGPGKS
jgi:ABC-type Fe3+-hydroxamate transport system substrate-binding protein